jgi:hypothetical protein
MKKLQSLILILFLATSLFAKNHVGSFKFMDFRNGNSNSFDTEIKVKYKIETLMGEPVVKAEAKYEIMGLVNIDGENYDLSKEKLNKLKIYNLKIKVPFETNSINKLLYIEIDMGAMGRQNEWSYNTPSSPNWDSWILDEVGNYLSKEEAIKAYKGFERLGVDDSLGSLATAVSIEFDVSATKENKKVLKDVWIDEETRLMWQDEVYSQREIDNYEKYYKEGKNVGKSGNWYHANDNCQDLILNSLSDWKLPTIDELNKIKDKRNNFKMKKVFRGVWSSDVLNSKEAMLYGFQYYDDGEKANLNEWKISTRYIRCVRNIK